MKIKHSLVAALAVIVIGVSGCTFQLGPKDINIPEIKIPEIKLPDLGGGITPTTANALPTLPEYSDAFRNEFADEVDQICGNERLGIKKQYDKSCVFIEDAIVLREQIRTIQARNP